MEVKHEEKNGALSISLNFSKEEVDCLKHDLPGVAGIVEWYSKGPAFCKVESCKKRMKLGWVEKLRGENKAIPASDSELVSMILSHPEYKDREKREKEAL